MLESTYTGASAEHDHSFYDLTFLEFENPAMFAS